MLRKIIIPWVLSDKKLYVLFYFPIPKTIHVFQLLRVLIYRKMFTYSCYLLFPILRQA